MGGVLVLSLVAIGVAWDRLHAVVNPPGCDIYGAAAGPLDYDLEQSADAATIAGISVKRSLPRRAAVIAIATSLQESKLRNLPHGDRDSLGLFQQRPSQGWGTEEQILDPVYATGTFYDHLVKVKNWQTRPLTNVAQDVQRSGFPEAYAKHETQANVLAAAFTGAKAEAVGCRLDAPQSPAAPSTVAKALNTELGLTARVDNRTLRFTGSDEQQAWLVASWAVAHATNTGATKVTKGGRSWQRSLDQDALSWHDARSEDALTDPLAVTIELAG